jgi:hypothetical protein
MCPLPAACIDNPADDGRVGEREARERGDDNMVPVRCERLQQLLELEIRARPAVEKQHGRLAAVAFRMNEVEVLAFPVGREVGECVEAPFDRTPVVAVPPTRRRQPQVPPSILAT